MLSVCPDWCWQYCTEQDRLVLQMSSGQHIKTAFSAKELTILPNQQSLCMEQAQVFMDFAEALEGLLPYCELLNIAAHAVAALYFVKTPNQKSHLFKFSSIECRTEVMGMAKLEGVNRAKVLLVAKSDPIVDCLLLEPVELLNGKTMSAGQLVRVQQNRLIPLQLSSLYALTA